MKIMNLIIGMLFVMGVCISCSDENELTPSMADKNYYAVPEGANDPESMLRREFYELNKSYLLFSDTLRKEEIGRDQMGNPVYSCELVDPGYELTMPSATQYRFAYIPKIEQQQAAVDFVQNTLLQSMDTKLRPYAFLIVDTIKIYQYKTDKDAIQLIGTTNIVGGKRCMTIGSTGKWGEMTETQKAQLKTQILMELIGEKIKKLGEAGLAEYYSVSAAWYGKTGWFAQLPAGTTMYEELGFLGVVYWLPEYDAYKLIPKVDDLYMFIDALFAMSKEEFYAKYAQFPLIIKKYEILLEIAKELGLKA